MGDHSLERIFLNFSKKLSDFENFADIFADVSTFDARFWRLIGRQDDVKMTSYFAEKYKNVFSSI